MPAVSGGTGLAAVMALLAGLAGSVQAAVMGRFGERVGLVEALAWVTFLSVLIAFGALLVTRQGLGALADVWTVPKWLWLGALLGTFVVFLAQLAGSAGVGAWPIGVSGLITAYIAVLAYRRKTDTTITRSDWAFLAVALAALPCWFVTSDPLWAVVILTGVDLAGFGPTFRSAYARPYDERMGFYLLGTVRNAFAIAALKQYSLTTVLFPAAVGIACLLFVAMVAYRRAQTRQRAA